MRRPVVSSLGTRLLRPPALLSVLLLLLLASLCGARTTAAASASPQAAASSSALPPPLASFDCAVAWHSSLYAPSPCGAAGAAGPAGDADSDSGALPLLLSGAGRSGTAFAAAVMQRAGLNVSHDKAVEPAGGSLRAGAGPLSHGAVSWPAAFRGSKVCPPPVWTWRTPRRFRAVTLLVRHPLAVAASRVRGRTVHAGRRWLAGPGRGTSARFLSCVSDMGRAVPTDGSRRGTLRAVARHWVLTYSFVEAAASGAARRLGLADERALWARLEAFSGADVQRLCNAAAAEGSALEPQQCEGMRARADAAIAAMHDGLNHCKSAVVGGARRQTCPDGSARRALLRQRGVSGASGSGDDDDARPVSWAELEEADPAYAAMAQNLAMRYGYEVPAAERCSLLPAVESAAALGDICGFRVDAKALKLRKETRLRWACFLPGHGDEEEDGGAAGGAGRQLLGTFYGHRRVYSDEANLPAGLRARDEVWDTLGPASACAAALGAEAGTPAARGAREATALGLAPLHNATLRLVVAGGVGDAADDVAWALAAADGGMKTLMLDGGELRTLGGEIDEAESAASAAAASRWAELVAAEGADSSARRAALVAVATSSIDAVAGDEFVGAALPELLALAPHAVVAQALPAAQDREAPQHVAAARLLAREDRATHQLCLGGGPAEQAAALRALHRIAEAWRRRDAREVRRRGREDF